MEMSVSISKDTVASLPGASVLPALPIAGTGLGKAVNDSSTDNGFSKKLSHAMDKSSKTETIATKKLQRSQKTGGQETTAEPATTGLAVGLAGNPQPPEVSPDASANPDPVNSRVPTAVNVVEGSAVFAQVIPVILPELGNTPLGIGKQGVADASAPKVPTMENPAVAPSEFDLTTVAPKTLAMPTPTVAPPAAFKETAAAESGMAEPIQIQRSKDSLPRVNVQAGIAKEPIRPQPNIPTISAEIGSNQDPKPIDARIQQDIVAVQVSSQPAEQTATTGQYLSQEALATTAPGAMGIPQTTAAKEVLPTTELEPVEVDPAIMVGKAEARPEPVATAQTEKEPTKQNLGRSEKDSLTMDSMDKTDMAAVPITPFEKTLSNVHSPLAPDTAAQQSRQDLNEVARQVMDGMTASTDRLKSSQVIITLRPEHLGEVTVKIHVDGDRVTAAFHAASSEVRAILESSMPQLRQEMSQNGWKFDSDGVYGGMQQFLADQHQQRQPEQGQTVIPMTRRLNREEYGDSMAAITPAGRLQVISAAAVDYRI
jgi:flagellar hook-length control protein FliK